MPRSLRLPPELEAEIKQLAEEHDRSENAEIIVAVKQYIRSQKTCSVCEEHADIECKIGQCGPGTYFCEYHYEQAHLPEVDRITGIGGIQGERMVDLRPR